MRKKKIFFPWGQEMKDYWLHENRNSIRIIGASEKDYYSKKEKRVIGKLTTIFYEEKE